MAPRPSPSGSAAPWRGAHPARDADLERAVAEAERALAEALAELGTLRAATQAKGEELVAVRRAEAVRTAELDNYRRRYFQAAIPLFQRIPMATQTRPTSAPETRVYTPFVPPTQSPAELTFRALLLGALLGLVFAASSVYLALKIGLTVSASIPIAVLSVAFFRNLGRSTILENNIVQTTGSAGESIAAGIVFTLPAILLMGYDLSVAKVAVVAVVGGVMGILLMIPLRRALIVKEHGRLTYPEGTACAEVLVAGEKGGLQARRLFQAFGIAFAYNS